MSDFYKKRNDFWNDVYNDGALALFSDTELNYINTPIHSGAASLLGDGTSYIMPEYDEKNNITGFKVKNDSKIPFLDSNGMPTEKTTQYVIDNAAKLGISSGEINILIRIRHGMDKPKETKTFPDGTKIYLWGDIGFNTPEFQNYIGNQIAAREIVKELNKESENVNKRISDGSIIEINAEMREPPTETGNPGQPYNIGKSTGVGPIFWDINTGQPYDPYKRFREIVDNHCGDNPECKLALGAEVTHLAMGTVSRNPDDENLRVDENGNVSGGATSVFAGLASNADSPGAYVEDEKGKKFKKKKKILVNSLKIPVQAISTASVIFATGAVQISSPLIVSRFTKYLVDFWHWLEGPLKHGHPSLLRNKLLWFKSIMGLIKYYNYDDAWTQLFEIAGPFIISLGIHRAAPILARIVGENVASVGDLTLYAEVLWLTWDSAKAANDIKQAIKKSKELKQELEKIAQQNGYDVDTFVNSGGTVGVPVGYFVKDKDGNFIPAIPIGTITGTTGKLPVYDFRRNELPVEYETDTDGNVIYEDDPTDPLGKRKRPKRTQVPAYGPVKPKTPPTQTPSGGREKYGIPSITDPSIIGYVPLKELQIDGIPQKDEQGRQIYTGVPYHGPNEELEYTSVIENEYDTRWMNNYLQNLFDYQTSINNANYSNSMVGPVNTNITTIGTPSGYDPGAQAALESEVKVLSGMQDDAFAAQQNAADEWYSSFAFYSNPYNGTDSASPEPTNGGTPTQGETIDFEIESPLPGPGYNSDGTIKTSSGISSYIPVIINSTREIFTIYGNGDVHIFKKPSQPYDRYI